MQLDMCYGVKHSCCKKEDQITMYEAWMGDNGEKLLAQRFGYYLSLY